MSLSTDLFRGKSPLAIGFGVLAITQTVGLIYLIYQNYAQEQKLIQSEVELDKQIKLRANERTGRISAQQANREATNKLSEENGYHYHPIGHIESPFPDRRGTPRQPVLVPAARGKIRFDKKVIQNEHFKELSQFSHVWVVFVFHNNTNTEKSNQIAKIKPPRLHGAKVGCLSTRSPHRPNNIGLSVCEVVGTGDDYIELRCVDMVHGTPVLDGKLFCLLDFYLYLM
jgi:tRNA-Thr(GGU) m(6)t(6)A37 methyltransferase TsaA